MAVQRVGSACLTTVSYTPVLVEEASDVNISVKIDRKMGSLLFFAQTSRTANTRELDKSVVSH
jgi:hypothetical protein